MLELFICISTMPQKIQPNRTQESSALWKSVQRNLLLFLERVLLSVTVINEHVSCSDRFLTSSGTAQGEGLGGISPPPPLKKKKTCPT